ncbi:MAG: carbohydrate kinase family protein [Thermomicrobiales bacterium]
MPPCPAPRIAALGISSWDTFLVVDEYPATGSFAVVEQSATFPGGTTANNTVALARLGARVSLVSLVGDDEAGRAVRSALEGEEIDLSMLGVKSGLPTDASTVVVSRQARDRTIYWHQGARLVRGDRLDVTAIFAHDLVIIDTDDLPLRRFLVDLPAHTAPRARLLGTLTYLSDSGATDALTVALGHDAVVGNERELCQIVGLQDFEGALIRMQQAMRTSNLRACAMTRGATGATIFTHGERWDEPACSVDVVDTTGAGDAFAGGIAYGLALRWEWPRIARFANAVAALSTRALGAQTALPTLDEVASLLGQDRATLAP